MFIYIILNIKLTPIGFTETIKNIIKKENKNKLLIFLFYFIYSKSLYEVNYFIFELYLLNFDCRIKIWILMY